jgi:Flp pilus assembly protein TadG
MIIKNHNGATAVEFAIILPVLILVLFGIIEFSLVLFNKHIITNASREGARAGIVSREDRFKDGDGEVVDDIVEAVVNSWVKNLITFGDTDEGATVVVEILDGDDPETDPFIDLDDTGHTWVDPCTSWECPLRVTVRYDYDFLVLSIFGFGPITLDGTSEMRME